MERVYKKLYGLRSIVLINYMNGVSEAISKVYMCLPAAGPYVNDDDVNYIVETIKSAIIR